MPNPYTFFIYFRGFCPGLRSFMSVLRGTRPPTRYSTFVNIIAGCLQIVYCKKIRIFIYCLYNHHVVRLMIFMMRYNVRWYYGLQQN